MVGSTLEVAGRIFLRTGRDGPVRGGNPWIFSHAIARIEPPEIGAGALVNVFDSGGDLLGPGYYNPATTIAIRMLAWGAAPAPAILIRRRIAAAAELRARFIGHDTDAYRLINGDGDGLSGVVVDRYGDTLVLQLLTAGADTMRAEIIAALAGRFQPRAIIERSQGAVRRQEGLQDRSVIAYGDAGADAIVTEHGIRFAVDFTHGQKTGAFLDQRENRAIARAQSAGARMLDAYCYGGAFAIAACAAGARRVIGVDTSTRALEAARRNLALNGFAADAAAFLHADAAEFMALTEERFDLIVIDPPPLARSRADADRAGRRYAELNALAMRILAPGGRLMTFSCSIHLRGDDFLRAVRIAQIKAHRTLRLIARLGPGPDHPVLLGHAEGEYLTGLMLADLDAEN